LKKKEKVSKKAPGVEIIKTKKPYKMEKVRAVLKSIL